jgi:hypothetical protein
MTTHTIFTGITTRTPLHISDSVEPTIGKKVKVNQTTKLKVPLLDNGETKMERIPVIHSNLLRGRIRRNIAHRIFESLRERGVGISVDFLHLVTSLAVSASPNSVKNLHNALKTDDPIAFMNGDAKPDKKNEDKEFNANSNISRKHIEAQTSDAFTALFGGGPNMWPSRLVTYDFLPNITDLLEPHLVNNELSRHFDTNPLTAKGYQLTQVIGAVKTDDLGKNLQYFDPDDKQVSVWIAIDSGATSSKEEKSKTKQSKSAKQSVDTGDDDEKQKESKINLRNMMNTEVVAPGVPFIGQFKVKMNGVSEEMLTIMKGLVLLGVDDLNNAPIGGLVRNGWGDVSASMIEDDDYAQARQAALDYIETVMPNQIMEAYGVAFR